MSEPREPDDREFSERFRQAYERTPLPGAEARARIVVAARSRPRPRRGWFGLAEWIEPRTITLRPIAAVAAAITLVAVGALLAHRLESPGRHHLTSNASAKWTPGTRAVRFVFVDGSASQVALVGDFNGWDASATPMRREPNGPWTISVSLPPGWHSYAFVIDGATWAPDPNAPLAPKDDFGTPRSVVVVGEHGV
jgi:hypothetical protein